MKIIRAWMRRELSGEAAKDHESYGRAKNLFLQVCSLDDVARAEVLARECGDNAALRAEVESLLRHHGPKTLIDGVTVGQAAPEETGTSAWGTWGRTASLLVQQASRAQRGLPGGPVSHSAAVGRRNLVALWRRGVRSAAS